MCCPLAREVFAAVSRICKGERCEPIFLWCVGVLSFVHSKKRIVSIGIKPSASLDGGLLPRPWLVAFSSSLFLTRGRRGVSIRPPLVGGGALSPLFCVFLRRTSRIKSVRPLFLLLEVVFELLLLCFVVCISKKKKLQKHQVRFPTVDGVLSNLFTMNIGPPGCAVFHVFPSFSQSFQHQTFSVWVLVLSPFFCISTKNKPNHERQTHLPWVMVFGLLGARSSISHLGAGLFSLAETD